MRLMRVIIALASAGIVRESELAEECTCENVGVVPSDDDYPIAPNGDALGHRSEGGNRA